jgi:hypothetical protein
MGKIVFVILHIISYGLSTYLSLRKEKKKVDDPTLSDLKA